MTTTGEDEPTTEVESTPLDAITFVTGTDIGMRREENQDSHGEIVLDHVHYYIVADGMGGVRGGATASKLSIEVFEKTVAESEDIDAELIEKAIYEANKTIFQKGKNDPTLTGMGTTFVGIGFKDDRAYTINVGDSRAYRIRKGKIIQLTEDHTLVQELVNSGALNSVDAENHPVSHMLTRSLGPTDSVKPDFKQVVNGPVRGDTYLLCSDGLYNLVTDEEILKIVSERSIESAQTECIRLANERGGTDNITVTIVHIGDDYPKGAEDYPHIDDTQTIEIDSDELRTAYVNGHAKDDGETPVISSSISLEDVAEQIPHEQMYEAAQEQSIPRTAPVGNTIVDSLPHPKILLTALPVSILILAFVIWYVPSNKQQVQQVARQEAPAQSSYTAPQKESSSYEPVEKKMPLRKEETTSEPRLPEPIAKVDPIVEAAKTLRERASFLEKRVNQIQLQILSLSAPLDGQLGESLRNADKERKDLEGKKDAIRSEVEVATRRLAIWYGRRKRLKDSEPVSLASEVAVVSPLVKDAKDTFEQATWQYLKASEALRYDPTNKERKREVAQLTQERKRYYRELLQAMKKAVDLEIAASDKKIAELSYQRDALNEEIAYARQKIEYQKIVMQGTPEEKDRKKKELSDDLAILQSELEAIKTQMQTESIYTFDDFEKTEQQNIEGAVSEETTSTDSGTEELTEAPVEVVEEAPLPVEDTEEVQAEPIS